MRKRREKEESKRKRGEKEESKRKSQAWQEGPLLEPTP